MTIDQIAARRALRVATFAIHWAQTDFDREVAKHCRARAARALRSALNVEKYPPMLLRRQAG
jgi:hypothetical protein